MSKIKKFFCVLMLCFAAINTYAAELNISVDKNVLTEADTLFLTIEYTGNDNQKPDVSPLNDNFRIVSNASSSQIRFVNGQMSQSKKWTLGLQPLKLGKITIPPLRIGRIISNSEEVEVREITNVAVAPDYKENTNSPYFQMEQTLDVTEPYLQQQATLLITIYDSIGLQDGSISIDEESKKDWIVLPLIDQPIVRQEVINRKKMNVETYAFAIFPQKSGQLPLPQLFFDGYYVKDAGFKFPSFGNDLNIFGVDLPNLFGQRVPIRMKTKNQIVNVKPIPENYSAPHWLPLSNLQLSSNWSIKDGFKVGEAVTRNFTLTAEGMTESMLPHINFAPTEGLKQYPEKPVASEKVENGLIVTAAQFKNVYIPTTSGELTIPEMKIDWFNVEKNTVETAVIPEETIFVLPNPAIAESKNEESTNIGKKETTSTNKTSEETEDILPENDKEVDLKSMLNTTAIFYAAIGGGIVLLLFVLLFVIMRHKKQNYKKDVIKAIRRHDYKKAKDNLIIWAKDKYYPANINNFNDIAQAANNSDFAKCLSDFNRFLYSDSAEFFDNVKFIEILKKVDRMKEKKVSDVETLPNLYK